MVCLGGIRQYFHWLSMSLIRALQTWILSQAGLVMDSTTGTALLDLLTAKLALKKAEERGLGQQVSL